MLLAASRGCQAAGSANGAQHDSLGFEPQENVTTQPRERQRRVPSGVIWMENGDDQCWEHRRALVIHGTRFQRWGMGAMVTLGLKPQAVMECAFGAGWELLKSQEYYGNTA